MLSLNGLMVLLFQASGRIPYPTGGQLVSMVTIMLVAALTLRTLVPRGKPMDPKMPFRGSAVLDVLSAITVLVFFACAVFLTLDWVVAHTSNASLTSARIVMAWTSTLALLVLGYRLYSGDPYRCEVREL